jgi:predicted DCC family thiol-disulfide oxidoreductase YuxK
MHKDTLYYDSACSLCRAEVGKLSKSTDDRLLVKNIHELDEAEVAPNKALLLSRLHLKTADGEWITGLRANIRAWHHTPFRYLWRMLDWPLISRLSHWCYEFWLRQRNEAR